MGMGPSEGARAGPGVQRRRRPAPSPLERTEPASRHAQARACAHAGAVPSQASTPTCLHPMTSGTSTLGSTACAASSMMTTSKWRPMRWNRDEPGFVWGEGVEMLVVRGLERWGRVRGRGGRRGAPPAAARALAHARTCAYSAHTHALKSAPANESVLNTMDASLMMAWRSLSRRWAGTWAWGQRGVRLAGGRLGVGAGAS